MRQHLLRRRDQRGSASLRPKLDLAGLVEGVHQHVGLGHCAAADEAAVIAQQQGRVVGQAAQHALAFRLGQRQALVVVIAELSVEAHGVLRDRQQAVELGRHGDGVHVVQVHDAMCVMARRVDGGVDAETDGIHLDLGIAVDLAVDIDLDQAGGGDFVEAQTEGVDQEGAVLARHAGGDVGIDQVVPAAARGETVGSGEIDAQRLFGGRDRRGGQALVGSEGEAHGRRT